MKRPPTTVHKPQIIPNKSSTIFLKALAFFVLLLATTILLPRPCFAQKIKSNTVDGFTNERTIETTIVPLKEGFSTGFGVAYMAVNNNYYMNIVGYGTSESMITEDSQLLFVLDDGSVVKFDTRLATASFDENYPNMYIHHYFVKLDDVEAMKINKLLRVRIVKGDGVNDISVSKKSSKQFAKLNDIFLNEVSK